METLRLDANFLAGQVPPELCARLPRLEDLSLGGNDFSGPLDLRACAGLVSLNVASNRRVRESGAAGAVTSAAGFPSPGSRARRSSFFCEPFLRIVFIAVPPPLPHRSPPLPPHSLVRAGSAGRCPSAERWRICAY
jgi:hypothetical protein